MEEESSTGILKPDETNPPDKIPPPADNANTAESQNTTEEDPPAISKRQLKKLQKKAQWEEKKKVKRQKERERTKQKRQTAMLEGIQLGPSRKELKRNKANKSPSNLRVAIDLDYDDLMIDKDVAKCVKQLLRIYTINRRSRMPATLHFTGIKLDGRIHEVLKKNDGYEHWDVQWLYQSYLENFTNDEIIYLTSDSDAVLKEIDPSKVYIIGGLVDHNHHKGLCYERANKLSLKTARLPLTEHVDMKTRTVLSTYHVFEIMLKLSEGKSWADAILETIPVRKGAKLKESKDAILSVSNGANENKVESLQPDEPMRVMPIESMSNGGIDNKKESLPANVSTTVMPIEELTPEAITK